MKSIIENYLLEAVKKLDLPLNKKIQVEKCKNLALGHFATNLAFIYAKEKKCSPRELAEQIVTTFPQNKAEIKSINVAGSGFINITLSDQYLNDCLIKAVQLGKDYGQANKQKEKILIEFVSANPTGPLHIGHGRSIAFGMVLANLLKKAGYSVFKEYYVNDAGRQMDILALSVVIKLLINHFSIDLQLPKTIYLGAYIDTIASDIFAQNLIEHDKISSLTKNPFNASSDKTEDQNLDDWISFAQNWLKKDWVLIRQKALAAILKDIQNDLNEFGLKFDNFYFESSLISAGKIEQSLTQLEKNNYLKKVDSATVFKSSLFGDKKDRVVIRSNGEKTYFANDIAYHLDKFSRADILINLWGSDHHGYVKRMQAALSAAGQDAKKLEVYLVQFVRLIKNKQKIAMSTRLGKYMTFRQLRQDISQGVKELNKNIGNDIVRFFYTQKKIDQHLDFDWDLAKTNSQENPVFYINYAYARINSVVKLAKKQGIRASDKNLHLLTEDKEKALIFHLLNYPNEIMISAQQRSAHSIAYYLLDLVALFHHYYNQVKFIQQDQALAQARIYLIKAVKVVIKNGLKIYGVKALKKM